MSSDNTNVLKTGTTTVGLVCKDGVVLAADKRVTIGGGTIMGSLRKVLPIGDRFSITMAGTVSDAQMLTRYIKSEIKLKELRSNNQVTVREAANLLAQFVFSNIRSMRGLGVTHFLLAGTDKTGQYLYDIFPDGSITEIPKYFCSGSGSVYAYGLLDGEYKENMSIDEAKDVARKAIRSAITRDAMSGNGYDIVAITANGVQDVETKVFTSPIEN